MDNDKSEIEKLTAAMKIANKQNSWWYGFFRGIMAGLGATIGLTIVIIILVYVLKQAQFVPWFGGKLETFLTPIAEQLQKTGAVK